jgi:hypothetical protein
VNVIRKAAQEQMTKRLCKKIEEHITIKEQPFSDQVRDSRPDLHFVAKSFGSYFTVLIHISCPYGRFSDGQNKVEKVYLHKLEKHNRLADETKTIRNICAKIIWMTSAPPTRPSTHPPDSSICHFLSWGPAVNWFPIFSEHAVRRVDTASFGSVL